MMNQEKIAALFDLSGQIAVLSDSGGLSSMDIAPLLASAGATVVIADQYAGKAQALAERIKADGDQAMALPTDIEGEASVVALFEAVKACFGRLDILVNCAGITACQPLVETTMQQYDDLQSINQRATFLMMREGVRLMLAAGRGGRIVNVTTMGSLHPVLHGNAAYGATRSSVTAMTRSVAMDHGRDGIRANLVLPGAIASKTRFHSTTQSALAAGRALSGPGMDAEHRLPLGMGSGRDIAAAVLYLVGPAGAYMSGQAIVLDGGFLCT